MLNVLSTTPGGIRTPNLRFRRPTLGNDNHLKQTRLKENAENNLAENLADSLDPNTLVALNRLKDPVVKQIVRDYLKLSSEEKESLLWLLTEFDDETEKAIADLAGTHEKAGV